MANGEGGIGTQKVVAGEVDGVDLDDLFNRFRHICEQLEDPNLPLEKSVSVYAQGVELQRRIKAELDSADRRMVTVMNQDGTTEPFDFTSGPQRSPGK
jgi:exodeoxyribonuclease VII small subunit